MNSLIRISTALIEKTQIGLLDSIDKVSACTQRPAIMAKIIISFQCICATLAVRNIGTVLGSSSSSACNDGSRALAVAVDAASNIFFTSSASDLRMFASADTSCGVVAPLGARTTSVVISAKPVDGLAFQAATGNLWVAKTSLNSIGVQNAVTGRVTFVAGSTAAGYCFDGAPVTTACFSSPTGLAWLNSTSLLVADTGNNVVRMLTVAPGGSSVTAISTFAGAVSTPGNCGNGGNARFACLLGPTSLVVAANGIVFICDTDNKAIRMVTRAGIISTLLSSGSAGYLPVAVAMAPSGNALLFADTSINVVRSIALTITAGNATAGSITYVIGNATTSTCIDPSPAISACLSNPKSLTTDASGNIYVVDTARMFRLNAATNILSSVRSSSAVNADGSVCANNAPGTSACLISPGHPASDASGNLYVPDTTQSVVYFLNASTGLSSIIVGTGSSFYSGDAGPAETATLSSPYSAVLNGNGTALWIADTGNNVIRSVKLSTMIITTVAGNNAMSASNNLYCGDGGAATSACLNFPACLAFNGNAGAWIADSGNNVIRYVSFNNMTITTVVGDTLMGGQLCGDGGAPLSACLNAPLGIAYSSKTGALLIADR